jgi:hypothetical protein
MLVMAGFIPAIHVLATSSEERRRWPGIGERSDTVLRTVMPGHDDYLIHPVPTKNPGLSTRV